MDSFICEKCPYEITDFQEKYNRLGEDYRPEYCWCDKVGGKHYAYGYCSECVFRDDHQKHKLLKSKTKINRYDTNKKYRNLYRARCHSNEFKSYIFYEEKYSKNQVSKKYSKRVCEKAVRNCKDIQSKGNYYRKLTYKVSGWNCQTFSRDRNTAERLPELSKMILKIKKDNTQMFQNFIDIIMEFGFFESLNIDEIIYFNEDSDNKYIPSLTCNLVEIGISIYDNNIIMVGIDPTKYFNKTSQCSIIGYFPISKRNYESFLMILKRIMDLKDSLRKEWLKNACNSFYGCCFKYIGS